MLFFGVTLQLMKNIAVLVYELTVEYNITVLDGIVSFFKDKKDINLIISPVNVPKANTAEFDYQYWTGVEILKSKQNNVLFLYTLDEKEVQKKKKDSRIKKIFQSKISRNRGKKENSTKIQF